MGFKEKNDFTFDDIVLPDPMRGPRLETILHPENGSEAAEGHYTTGRKAAVCDRYTLTDHLWKYLRNYAEKHRLKGNGFGFGLNGPDDVARTLSARYYKDGSEILIKQRGKNPRRLTPRECARLMGFDKPWQSDFKIPVSEMRSWLLRLRLLPATWLRGLRAVTANRNQAEGCSPLMADVVDAQP